MLRPNPGPLPIGTWWIDRRPRPAPRAPEPETVLTPALDFDEYASATCPCGNDACGDREAAR